MSGDKEAESAIRFSEALEELEGILSRIESEETDVDRLGDELRRAAGLLELCRNRIRKAEVEVRQIVQSLDAGSEASEKEARAEAPPAEDGDGDGRVAADQDDIPF